MPEWMRSLFPLLMIGLAILNWLLVTTLLSAQSGWFRLMKEFSNRDHTGSYLATFYQQSGMMGAWCGIGNLLEIDLYEGGLGIKIPRVFSPFVKPLFIPWSRVSVERERHPLVGNIAILHLGDKGILSRLMVEDHVANAFWRRAGTFWPETGPVPGKDNWKSILKGILPAWPTLTLALVLLLLAVNRLVQTEIPESPESVMPTSEIIVIAPAVITVVTLYRFFSRLLAARADKHSS